MTDFVKKEAQIGALIKKAAEMKKALSKTKARIRARESKGKSKTDNAKKMLVGAFVLDQLGKSGVDVARFFCEGATLDSWLVRDRDRELFGLAPLAPASPSAPGTQPG